MQTDTVALLSNERGSLSKLIGVKSETADVKRRVLVCSEGGEACLLLTLPQQLQYDTPKHDRKSESLSRAC